MPGLRREEVALRAGTSVEWYTRLERGPSPSARVGVRIEPERALDSLTAAIGLPTRLRVVDDVG